MGRFIGWLVGLLVAILLAVAISFVYGLFLSGSDRQAASIVTGFLLGVTLTMLGMHIGETFE